MLRLVMVDVATGVVDSLRGFAVLHKLDAAEAKGKRSKSSDEAPLTTLALRRRERARRQADSPSSTDQAEDLGKPPSAVKRLAQCVGVNVGCMLVLDGLLLPLIDWLVALLLGLLLGTQATPSRAQSFVRQVVGALWLLPLFLVTRLVNALWFSDIASAAQRLGGKAPAVQSFSRGVADLLVAILLETLFLLQSFAVGFLPVPYVAPLAHFCHLSLLYSLYSFEYCWMGGGVELTARLRRIENHWPYYLGFGAPLALLTLLPSSFIVSGCLFGMAFPFCIVASFRAPPPPSARAEKTLRPPAVRFFGPSMAVCGRLSRFCVGLARPHASALKRQ